MKRLLACVAVLALVGACEKKSEDPAAAAAGAEAGASGPSAPAAAASVPADLADGPAAGNWKMTVTSMGATMPATEFCYKTKTSLEEAAKMQQAAGVTCSEQSYKKEGDGWTGHSVCSVDIAGKKTTTTTDTKVTGDFNTKYTMDISSKMDPAPMPGMEEQKMSITAERIGDC